MRSAPSHMLAFCGLLALLLLVANSGFTVALSYCTMCDTEAETMACCAAPMDGPSEACRASEDPVAGAAYLPGGDSPCLLSMVVGGTPEAPTIFEREAAGREHFPIALLQGLPQVPASRTAREPDTTLLSHGTAHPFPLPVEKYVLHGTFRI